MKPTVTFPAPMSHARLSASAAHRWAACPGSVALSEGVPNRASAAASQGTFAHHIAAECLKGRSVVMLLEHGPLDPAAWLGNKTIIDGHTVECDQEMVNGVREYLTAIMDDLQLGDQVWIEEDVTPALQKLDPRFGGNSDFIRYRPSTRQMRVRDLKYGSGVFVEAENNVQVMMYALGALLKTGAKCDEVVVTIDQPRIQTLDGTTRDFKFSAGRIIDFAADLIDAARAVKPGAPLVPGPEQCGFCPARHMCPALERQQHELVVMDFDRAVAYDPVALAKGLSMIPTVKAKIKALEEFAYAEAERGVQIPGWKLVEKRATRKWIDEAAVVAWAEANAVDPYEPPVLKSPAQLEKGLSKPAKAGMAALTEKKSSGHALVPETDDRPAVKPLSADEFDVAGEPTKLLANSF